MYQEKLTVSFESEGDQDKYFRDLQTGDLIEPSEESFTQRLKRALSIVFRNHDPKNALIREMIRELLKKEEEVEDFKKSFRLYQSCIKRASVAYRGSHPGSTGLPDSMAALVAYMELKENETPKTSHKFCIEQRKVARHEPWEETSFFSDTETGAIALKNLLAERFKNFKFRVTEVEKSFVSKKKVVQ